MFVQRASTALHFVVCPWGYWDSMEVYTHCDRGLLYKSYFSNWKTISVGVIPSLCSKIASPKHSERRWSSRALAYVGCTVRRNIVENISKIYVSTKIVNEIWSHDVYMDIVWYCMLHEMKLLHRPLWSRYERKSIAANIIANIGSLVHTWLIKLLFF